MWQDCFISKSKRCRNTWLHQLPHMYAYTTILTSEMKQFLYAWYITFFTLNLNAPVNYSDFKWIPNTIVWNDCNLIPKTDVCLTRNHWVIQLEIEFTCTIEYKWALYILANCPSFLEEAICRDEVLRNLKQIFTDVTENF